jgi:GNAT superfamily N-acetyltransferase
MTFPAYRHLLSLEAAPRHPEQGDDRLVQPLGFAAWRGSVPAGVVLAETPVAGSGTPVMLSLYVTDQFRNNGIGTALVGDLERALQAGHWNQVEAVYTTGAPGIPALERVLEKRAWSAPVVRMVTVRFTPEEAASTPWFGRVKLPPPDYEIFPWTDLTADERAELKRSHEVSGWIATGLEPWRHDRHGFDAVSSVGLRHKGQVVGWVINHRTSPRTVRFTCSFMRSDLARRGRILGLYTASLNRLRNTECEMCSLVTPVCYGPMVEFLKRRCIRWISFSAETRGVSKPLGGGY